MSNNHKNEYIIFCKNHNFKSKNNKKTHYNEWASQEAKAIVYLIKGLFLFKIFV